MTTYHNDDDDFEEFNYFVDSDVEATTYANEQVRKNAKKNPCGLCEDVDCEGCKYFK